MQSDFIGFLRRFSAFPFRQPRFDCAQWRPGDIHSSPGSQVETGIVAGEPLGASGNLADYQGFISRLLEDNQRHGGVAIKFEVAYFRPLHFGDPSANRAAEVYSKYRKGGVPTRDDYLDFQDYVFRYLITEAGRLHLPVHIHTAVGIGDFFSLSEDNVLQLESILRDPGTSRPRLCCCMADTHSRIRRSGWRRDATCIWTRRSWSSISILPNSRMCCDAGCFCFPRRFCLDRMRFHSTMPWERRRAIGWQCIRRSSLAAALAEMVCAHEVTEEKALGFAHAYLHDTAAKMYGVNQSGR